MVPHAEAGVGLHVVPGQLAQTGPRLQVPGEGGDDVGHRVTPALGSVTVDVLWSLEIPPTRSALELEQDLYMLWPGEVTASRTSILNTSAFSNT